MWLRPEDGHFFHSMISILTWTEIAGLLRLLHHARPPLSCRQWEKIFMSGDRFGDTVLMAAAKGSKPAILGTCLDIEARVVSITSNNWVRLSHAVLDALRDSLAQSCIYQAAKLGLHLFWRGPIREGYSLYVTYIRDPISRRGSCVLGRTKSTENACDANRLQLFWVLQVEDCA